MPAGKNFGWSTDFQLNGYGAQPAPTYQLGEPSLHYTPDAPNLGNYSSQLSMGGGADVAGSAASGMSGSMIGAAGQAAATTAQLISQAAMAQAQRDSMAEQGGLDRATKLKLLQMQIEESKRSSGAIAQQNAYKMLMNAYANRANNEGASFAGKRNANSSMDELLAAAFLHRR